MASPRIDIQVDGKDRVDLSAIPITAIVENGFNPIWNSSICGDHIDGVCTLSNGNVLVLSSYKNWGKKYYREQSLTLLSKAGCLLREPKILDDDISSRIFSLISVPPYVLLKSSSNIYCLDETTLTVKSEIKTPEFYTISHVQPLPSSSSYLIFNEQGEVMLEMDFKSLPKLVHNSEFKVKNLRAAIMKQGEIALTIPEEDDVMLISLAGNYLGVIYDPTSSDEEVFCDVYQYQTGKKILSLRLTTSFSNIRSGTMSNGELFYIYDNINKIINFIDVHSKQIFRHQCKFNFNFFSTESYIFLADNTKILNAFENPLRIKKNMDRVAFEEKYSGMEFFEPVASIAKDWKEINNDEDNSIQLTYKQFCAETARQAVRSMERKEQGFESLRIYFEYFAIKRKEIGKQLGHDERYGKPRSLSEVNPMREIVYKKDSFYSSQYEFLKEKILNYVREGNSANHSTYTFSSHHHPIYDVQIYGYGIEKVGSSLQIVKVPYSRFVFHTGEDCIFVSHITVDDFPKAFAYACFYYKNIVLMKTENKEELKQTIRELEYLLYHMMPLSRGSSATTLMMISALLQLHFIPPEPNSSPINPDFNAFVSKPFFPSATIFKNFDIEIKNEVELKIAFDCTQSELPRHERYYISIKDYCTIYPFKQHAHIPFEYRLPNAWRTDWECLLLNDGGKKKLEQETVNDQKFLFNKIKGKLKQPIKDFLQDPINLLALRVMYFRSVALNPSDDCKEDFIKFLNILKLSRAQAKVAQYKRSQVIFEQIDRMPYRIREIFTHTLNNKRRSKINNNFTLSFPGEGCLSLKDCEFLETIIPKLTPKLSEMKIDRNELDYYIKLNDTTPFLLKLAKEMGYKDIVSTLEKRNSNLYVTRLSSLCNFFSTSSNMPVPHVDKCITLVKR